MFNRMAPAATGPVHINVEAGGNVSNVAINVNAVNPAAAADPEVLIID